MPEEDTESVLIAGMTEVAVDLLVLLEIEACRDEPGRTHVMQRDVALLSTRLGLFLRDLPANFSLRRPYMRS